MLTSLYMHRLSNKDDVNICLYLYICWLDYPHAITIVSPVSGSDKKQVLNFCAQSSEELLKFVEDLKESIAEVTEMEQIRIECECIYQKSAVNSGAGETIKYCRN